MKRGLLYGSVVFTCLCVASGIYYYRLYANARAADLAQVPVQIIAQTGPEKGALKTDYLAELLGLTGSNAPFLQSEKLLESPLIKQVELERITPGILSVDYSLRKPYVFLGNYHNIALDREGIPFPFFPFYTPKNMPVIYLSETDVRWHAPIKNRELAFEILNFLEDRIGLFDVKSLDVSRAHHPSLGRREVVLVVGQHTLRLTPLNYQDEMERYKRLECAEGDLIIDLRLPKLAFIKEK